MVINTRTVGNCIVLDCSGKLTAGPSVTTLHNTLREAITGRQGRIVLNLKEVEYSDSCGIGELVSSLTHVQHLGGELVLLNLNKYVEHLLTITQLLPVFEVYKEEAAALAGAK